MMMGNRLWSCGPRTKVLVAIDVIAAIVKNDDFLFCRLDRQQADHFCFVLIKIIKDFF
jgi:hypothetical protein